MTAQSEIVRQSELLNQLVIDRQTMQELGRVEVLWMYPQVHRVLGFICKAGFLGTKKLAFNLDQIVILGANGILTHAEPSPTDAARVSLLESLLNHEIWSETGDRIGKITDCLFNLRTGEITYYLFVSNGWSGILGEVYQLAPSQILSFGEARVLVPQYAIDRFPFYREGIRQKFTKVSDSLKEDVTEEWRSIANRAETASEQAKGRFQSFTEHARERAQRLSQQAKETAQGLSEQLREDTQTWVEQVKDKSQTIASQVKEQTHNLSRHVEEGIEVLTVHAEEIFDSEVEESPEHTPSSKTPAYSSQLEDEDDEPWNDESWTILYESPQPSTPSAPSISESPTPSSPSIASQPDDKPDDKPTDQSGDQLENQLENKLENELKNDEDDSWLEDDFWTIDESPHPSPHESSPSSSPPTSKPLADPPRSTPPTPLEDEDDELWI